MINFDTSNNQVMQNLNQLKLEATGTTTNKINSPNSSPFNNYVKGLIESVDTIQKSADELTTKFTKEDPSISLSQVMIQMQKAEVALSALVAARNKVIDGYKNIMNMAL